MQITINDGVNEPIKVELGKLYSVFQALKKETEVEAFMVDNMIMPCDTLSIMRVKRGGTAHDAELQYCHGLDDWASIALMLDICSRFVSVAKGSGETGKLVDTSYVLEHDDSNVYSMGVVSPCSPSYQRYLINATSIFCREKPSAGDRFTWIDGGFIYRLTAADMKGACDEAARFLLSLHTQRVCIMANFDTGYTITAPAGLDALWFDYALTVANSPIIVCEECGKPIIEDKRQRRFERRFCSDKCRVRNNRKKQRLKNQEIARLTGRGDKE